METSVTEELNQMRCIYLYNPFFSGKWNKKSGYIFLFLWNSLKSFGKFENAFVNKQLPSFLVSIFCNDQRCVKVHSEFPNKQFNGTHTSHQLNIVIPK